MKQKTILSEIAESTKGKSYKTSKFEFSGTDIPLYEYDDRDYETKYEGIWEDEPPKNSKNMKDLADEMLRSSQPSIFKYFLDGSRRAYKVDDISYANRLYPIIAGQISVGCCYRDNKELKPLYFSDGEPAYKRELLISLPKIAKEDDWADDIDCFNNLTKRVNQIPKLSNRKMRISKIIPYETASLGDSKIENRGVARIQSYMIEQEKELVQELNKTNLLNDDSYLLKDGTLEYRVLDFKNKRDLVRFQNNYHYVVGASKSFNPEKCVDKDKRNYSDLVANLPLYHRTAAIKYSNPIIGQSSFAVWFVRIREAKYSSSPLDGILKLEIMLTTSNSQERRVNTEDIDRITASVINERDPVCYGVDTRWANHLYPIHLTERFLKSKYLSTDNFLSLF